MNVDIILRSVAIAVGVGILLSNFVNVRSLIAKLAFKKSAPSISPVVLGKVDNSNFIGIVDMWYKLRTACVQASLPDAVAKLDEVFPLLNDNVSIPTPNLKATLVGEKK